MPKMFSVLGFALVFESTYLRVGLHPPSTRDQIVPVVPCYFLGGRGLEGEGEGGS